MIDRFWCGWLLTALVFSVGCGGGGSKGPTLDQQLKKATALPDPAMRAKQVAPLGEKQLAAGDVINGDKTLKFAFESAMEVEEPGAKASALIVVGQSMGRAKKTTEAKKAFREAAKALDALDVTKDPGVKAQALADLGSSVMTHLNNADAAVEHFKNAELAAEKIEVPAQKAAVYGRIMNAYLKAERKTEAAATQTKAMEFITALEKPRDRSACLAEMGETLAKAKRTDEANTLFAEATKIASEIKEDEARGYTYLTLGRKFKGAGRADEAREAFSKAEDAAGKIKDSSAKGPLVADIQAARK